MSEPSVLDVAPRVGPRSCRDGGAHPSVFVRVVTRHGNHSAFNGYRFTPSDYSSCRCLRCGAYWRTNAKYVEGLPDAHGEESW